MSLVIAIKDRDRIVLGSDKQVSAGPTKSHATTKI
jgi:20S proteasome alpha/beta subunit